MLMTEAMKRYKEYLEFRNLSPNTINGYMKELKYLRRYLEEKKDSSIYVDKIELENIEYNYGMELAEIYLSNLNYSKAIETLVNMVPKFKTEWKIYYLLGMAYRGSGDNQASIEYFESALEINPLNLDIYNELGIAYFNEEDILSAIEVFAKGIESNNEDYRLYFNRGLGYLNIGQMDKGYSDILKANLLNPGDENIKNQLEVLKKYFNNNNN